MPGFVRIALLAWIVAATIPARAQDLTAEQLVDRVAGALGGRDRLAAVQGYQLVSEAAGLGLSGTARVWTAFPDRQRSELSLPPLSLISVQAAGEAWLRDHNGHVIAFNERQLAAARTGLYIDSWRPWIEPFDPDRITLAGTEMVHGVACPALEMTVPGGVPWRVTIDPGTWLPAMESHLDESGLGHEVLEMADYRPVEGIQVPHRVRSYNDALPANHTTYTLRSLTLQPPAEPGLFARPDPVPDVTWTGGSSAVELPLVYRTGHAFVEVHVIGAAAAVDGLFLLDTGATLSMIDRDVLDDLNLTPAGDLDGLAIGGPMEVELVGVPFLRLDGVLLEDQVLGTSPIAAAMTEQLKVPVMGVLGYDFFSRFAVTLDFTGGRCVLRDPVGWEPPADGATLAIDFVDQQPAVSATLDHDLAGLWRLDTGADAVAVHGPAAAAWGLTERHATIGELVTAGIGGETAAVLLRADSFRLGPYEVDAPLVIVPKHADSVLDVTTLAGNLGTSVLDRFVVTVDFARGRLHLVPGPGFSRRDRIRTVDALIDWVGTRVEVVAVEPGGSAEAAGLRPGQEVLRIGGRAATRWTPGELDRLWAGENHDAVTVVVRGEDGGRKRVRLSIPPAP